MNNFYEPIIKFYPNFMSHKSSASTKKCAILEQIPHDTADDDAVATGEGEKSANSAHHNLLFHS